MDSVNLETLRQAVAWQSAGLPVTLATVVRTWGSSPRPEGALLAICGDGRPGRRGRARSRGRGLGRRGHPPGAGAGEGAQRAGADVDGVQELAGRAVRPQGLIAFLQEAP